MRQRLAGLAISVAFICGFRTLAQVQKTPDKQLGAQLAARGTPAGVVACVRCHGFDGNSDGSGAFPSIAGQSEFYLQKQLVNYASNSRRNAIMSPIAAKLKPEELAAVALYYSSLPAHPVAWNQADSALIQRGMKLATIGDLSDRVEACQSCHGPNGSGEPPDVPRLAGQYSHYLETQLHMWQRGYRKNDPGGQMKAPSHNLKEQDIAAVAAYFEQLPIAQVTTGGKTNAR